MKTNKGFTLIELLVVVLIIGILAAIALPMYTKTVEKSRVSEAMTLGKSISDARARLFLEHGAAMFDDSIYDNFEFYDVAIPGEPAESDPNQTIRTKHFEYYIGDTDRVRIERYTGSGENISWAYAINFYNSSSFLPDYVSEEHAGKITCSPYEDKWAFLCKGMGKLDEDLGEYVIR